MTQTASVTTEILEAVEARPGLPRLADKTSTVLQLLRLRLNSDRTMFYLLFLT